MIGETPEWTLWAMVGLMVFRILLPLVNGLASECRSQPYRSVDRGILSRSVALSSREPASQCGSAPIARRHRALPDGRDFGTTRSAGHAPPRHSRASSVGLARFSSPGVPPPLRRLVMFLRRQRLASRVRPDHRADLPWRLNARRQWEAVAVNDAVQFVEQDCGPFVVQVKSHALQIRGLTNPRESALATN
jgi:hypothetical protein